MPLYLPGTRNAAGSAGIVGYTYDDRGYLIAESTQEAREMDPYGLQPHTPYKPEKQGKDCDHGRNKTLSYYLLEMERSYTCVKFRSSWPAYCAGLELLFTLRRRKAPLRKGDAEGLRHHLLALRIRPDGQPHPGREEKSRREG